MSRRIEAWEHMRPTSSPAQNGSAGAVIVHGTRDEVEPCSCKGQFVPALRMGCSVEFIQRSNQAIQIRLGASADRLIRKFIDLTDSARIVFAVISRAYSPRSLRVRQSATVQTRNPRHVDYVFKRCDNPAEIRLP